MAAAAPREKADCVVIGAGVIGLAVARKLAMDGRSVIVVEAESGIGSGTSSRNSEVVHAGIYYPTGSLKARMCVQGRRALYAYCREHNVPLKRLGKLVVATRQQQVAQLQQLLRTGQANGAPHLRLLTSAQALRLEPQLSCIAALWSPSTAVLDSHAYMLSLQAAGEERGVCLALNTSVVGGSASEESVQLFTRSSSSKSSSGSMVEQGEAEFEAVEAELVLCAKNVVNCAGLRAQAVARTIQGLRADSVPCCYFAKGNYFRLEEPPKPAPFARLIYPVPEEGGLGVHLTLDLAGQMRFGPDVEWLPYSHIPSRFLSFDYGVDASRADVFYSQISSYFPGLPVHARLVPDYSGIRPKLSGPGQPAADFVIQDGTRYGAPGLVNLYGIESPGLTASLAIARHVSRLVNARGIRIR